MSQPAIPELSQLAFLVSGILAGTGAPALGHRRVGEGYAAARTVYGSVLDVGESVTVRFALGGAIAIDFVRLDIPAIPGTYRIERIALRGIEIGDLARRVIAVRDRLLDGAALHQIRYASDGLRPTVEIDLRGLASGPAMRPEDDVIDVLVAREDAAVELRTAIASNAQAHADLVRKHARELGELAFAQGREARRQTSRLGEQAAQLSAVTEALARQDARLDRVAEHSAASFQDVQARLAAVSETLSHLQIAQQQTEGRLQQLHEAADRLSRAIENVFWRRWMRRLRGAAS